MMIQLIKTDSSHQDFVKLVFALDAYLRTVDGDEHAFYNQYNKIDNIKYAILAYQNNIPIGCGAMKYYDDDSMEIKRMFVDPKFRRLGAAQKILCGLEEWAGDLGYNKFLLETGRRQTEAIALYQKCNYQIISNFGPYKGVENSCCFEKYLRKP